METEGPYTYPLTDRAAIEAWLGEHEAYVPMNTCNGGFCLAWDIKCNYHWDTSGVAYRDQFKLEERYDEAWEQVIESDNEMFYEACEDATRMYTGGEWTRYPGIEQGEYKFSISGRSGGWMLLDTCPIADATLVWADRGDFQQWLQDLDNEDLNTFYQTIVQLDHDLSRDACRQEMEYQYAYRRSVWEEEQVEMEERAARKLEASRPDMYTEVWLRKSTTR